ncbi:PREDICTED: uncharacterized protein LOC108360250 [Rhagoletis zephyria]|uniref:uncharacterized protein LOC108360250 n=1 Tax=Rhagoletis zephyria TaxID=28612 RepID=UPI0008119E1B|nr:PREDICTED: uncharacterized protein LOC108360250 [Rhagoletis zephyria]
MVSNSKINSIDDNSRIMLNVLCNQQIGLNIVHFNVRSLNNIKMDYVRYVFTSSAVDVICVSETWFPLDVSDVHFNINNYKIIRKDRVGKKGGGVAIYCKTHINMKLVGESDNGGVEYLLVELSDRVKKCLVSCVYNPNKFVSISPLFDKLSNIAVDYENIILCGDFNINLLAGDSFCSSLLDNVASLGLSAVNISMPTRYCHNSSPSLLDYFIVSDRSSVLKFDQISFVSDHDLIFCSLDINFNGVREEKLYVYRDFRSIDLDALYRELDNVNWYDCWYFESVNEKLEHLNNKLLSAYNTYVPLRYKKTTTCHWFNGKVREAIKSRTKAYRTWKRNRTTASWDAFRVARNKATLVQAKDRTECMLDVESLNDVFLCSALYVTIRPKSYVNYVFERT